MRRSARHQLEATFEQLQKRLEAEQAHAPAHGFDELRGLKEEIAVAYG